MDKAITIGDVLMFVGIGVGLIIVFAIIIAVLEAIASGYRH